MSGLAPETKEKNQTKNKIKKPGKYNVIFHNDDVTPMDYVIELLMRIFNIKPEEAYHLTMKVHHEGRAVVGVYIKEIALAKKETVDATNAANGFSLKSSVEPVEE